MGKRPKKKGQGGAATNKMGAASRPASSTTTSSTASPSESGRVVLNCGAVDTLSGGCPHGANLDKLRNQLAKSTVIHCLDCAKLRVGVSTGKERKGKGNKVVRRKLASPSLGAPVDDKNNIDMLWICLSCGHVGCGGGNLNMISSKVGGQLNKQEMKQGIVGRGHAWQHWLQLKHPLVMQCRDEVSCWCFRCELVHELARDLDDSPESGDPSPAEGEEEASTSSSRVLLLQQSAKLIREKMNEKIAGARDDAQEHSTGAEEAEVTRSPIEFVNGVHGESEAPNSKRVVKGLINLGNTCFFNSVMQNLLSVELLRNHFGPESPLPEGALTSSLRKFFQEASAHSSSETSAPPDGALKKSVKARGGWSSIDGPYNPKGLFGAICSKAPRFKGFQQQDSHELLRCLLDGLHTEEESSWKATSKSRTGGGEDALRALSETEACENGSKTEGDDLEDAGVPSQDGEVTAEEDVAEQKALIRRDTFVERVFGGQLSSTVSCCECGHSSVVYESFLDLSLPIPSKKPSKKGSALENGSSALPSTSQRVQALKSSKASSKTDPDLEVLRSIPAGLGAPLLLLPPPPLKDNNDDFETAGNGWEGGWLDYIDSGTGSGEADWMDVVEVGREVESGAILDTPNPESQRAPGYAPSLDSEIVFSCAPDPDLMKQPPGISVTSEGNGILALAADASHCSVEFEQNGNFGGALSFFAYGNATYQSLDSPVCEKFLVLDESCEAVSEGQNSSRICGSGLRPIRSQETDVQVQMRGGSETHIFDSAQEAELSNDPVAEQLIDTGASVEQLGDCSDDTGRPSDINTAPDGTTVILLGPPVDNGVAGTYSNVDLEGEYDGVGLLFEEEENTEDMVYGPVPMNHNGARFDESTYDEIVFDDVLDLSKTSSKGRAGDWLVTNEERQGEENDEASMSIEGCLQIFTRSELLSGENAWACENCTNKYHEELALLPVTALGAAPQKHLVKRSVSSGRIEGRDLSGKKSYAGVQAGRESPEDAGKENPVAAPGQAGGGSSKNDSPGDPILCNRFEDGEVDRNGDFCGNAHELVKSEAIGSSSNLVASERKSSAVCGKDGPEDPASLPGHNMLSLDGAIVENNKGVDGGQEQEQLATLDAVDNTSTKPAELKGVVIRRDSEGEMKSGEEVSVFSDKVENIGNGVEVAVLNNHNLEVETRTAELEKKGSQVNTRSSGKTSKLKSSKSRKVPEEQKKVIKQDATKRFLISWAPPVLTIQLKRFAQDMRGRLSKLSGHIAFQEWLDLHPFLDHRYVNFDCKYRLIGTVEHSGTLKSGHYVAFVRGPPAMSTTELKNDVGGTPVGASSWYYISDSHVHQTNLNAVLQSEAYLVFYERVDLAASTPY